MYLTQYSRGVSTEFVRLCSIEPLYSLPILLSARAPGWGKSGTIHLFSQSISAISCKEMFAVVAELHLLHKSHASLFPVGVVDGVDEVNYVF